MDKYLITGFAGFVCKYFVDYLESRGTDIEIMGVDINAPFFDLSCYDHVKWNFKTVDLLDKQTLRQTISEFEPHYILHLASYSSVSFSWKEPTLSFLNNTHIFLNLLEVIKDLQIDPRILSVGSSEEYGKIDPKDLPIRETHPLNPTSPYAVARVSQELLSRVYVEAYGMNIVLTRSFNHIGPGQKEIFVIPSFAKQLSEAKKKGLSEGIIEVGDISVIRDFVDVRDVVEAYFLLLTKGRIGEIYNVCSGKGESLGEIIELMGNILNLNVKTQINKELFRPNDNRIIIGSNEKINKDFDWSNAIPLRESLVDLLRYWERKV